MEEIAQIVDLLEVENGKRAVSDPMVQASIEVVESFLKNHPVLCYGGTAINNLLPKEDQFYDRSYEIPDYDFFSRTPQEHAMILANQLADRGIKNVEVKPGMHLGTFKVFADYAGVADITQLDADIFERLWKETFVKSGIHYVSPNFLRMSVYLELSRPQGDVTRWIKVYKRLTLLNKQYPLVCPGATAEPTPLSEDHRKEVESILHKHKAVLLGITASQIHERKRPAWSTPVTLLMNKEDIDVVTKDKTTKARKGSEVLPNAIDVLDNTGVAYMRIYETVACHSFHEMANGIRVASIPTTLQFFFAYMYSGAPQTDITHLLCVAQRLVDIAHSKPKRRFALLTPVDCLGKQETLIDMRKHKALLYEKLSKKKSSADFLRYFFTYDPHVTKTQRQKVRNQLRRTRRARSETP
jgi:hypothetical protein